MFSVFILYQIASRNAAKTYMETVVDKSYLTSSDEVINYNIST